MDRKEIQRFILDEYRRRGVSRNKFAEMAGCTSEAVRHWLNGKRLITYEQAEKVAKSLGFKFIVRIEK